MLQQGFACARLPHSYMTRSSRAFDHDVHHRGFCPKQLMAVWSPLLQDGSEGSTSFISRTARRSRAFLTQHHQDLGANHFERRSTEIKAKRLAAQIAKLGFQVELRPIAGAA